MIREGRDVLIMGRGGGDEMKNVEGGKGITSEEEKGDSAFSRQHPKNR